MIFGNVAELPYLYSEVKELHLMAEGGPVLLKEKDTQLPASPTQLNIGGFLYYTTLDTLTKQDNMLRAMFSGRLDVKTDGDGT